MCHGTWSKKIPEHTLCARNSSLTSPCFALDFNALCPKDIHCLIVVVKFIEMLEELSVIGVQLPTVRQTAGKLEPTCV
jgi:hypothetical protein